MEPVRSTAALERANFAEVAALIHDWAQWSLIVDLRVAALPGPAVRRELRVQFCRVQPAPRRVHLVVGDNAVIRAAVRYVFRNKSIPLSLHRDYGDALAAARRAAP